MYKLVTMVKNQGGNKSKRMGRKFLQKGPAKTRFSEDPDELYAVCIKMHGPSCDVLCIDGKTRLCFIRNKFKGRGKQDSLISIGTWLLVGRRGFEGVRENRKENTDLMEVYSQNDKKTLQQHEHTQPWSILHSIQSISGSNPDDDAADGLVFGDDDTNDYEELVKASIKNETVKMIGLDESHEEDEDDDIDSDDI
jgi:hypothetical protein